MRTSSPRVDSPVRGKFALSEESRQPKRCSQLKRFNEGSRLVEYPHVKSPFHPPAVRRPQKKKAEPASSRTTEINWKGGKRNRKFNYHENIIRDNYAKFICSGARGLSASLFREATWLILISRWKTSVRRGQARLPLSFMRPLSLQLLFWLNHGDQTRGLG